ncbi:MAG: purine-nucleoside phosphorylase [Cyclobacteriaceae bacterium]|jgi:purine-nucleoside phosphorylase
MFEKVKEAVAFLKKEGFEGSKTAIILGTGLGGLVNHIEITKTINYSDIPHFPISTMEFHKGKMILGTLEGKLIIAMQGRFHYYEGYSMAEVVMPVRVMKYLGVEKLLISNAAGNMNMDWKKGQLMLLRDHINLQPDNPLRGSDAAMFGQIFTDMSEPYNQKLNEILTAAALSKNIPLNKGIYVAVSGPNLETKAEYRFLRNAGADVVGMSTVPEVIAANQIGLPVAAISVLTDDCDPDNLMPINIEEIIKTAESAEKDLIAIIRQFMVLNG